jgi:hypothetical protein
MVRVGNKKHSSTACFLKGFLCSRETYVRNVLTSKDMESLNMTFDKDKRSRGTSFLKWRNYSTCFFSYLGSDSEVMGEDYIGFGKEDSKSKYGSAACCSLGMSPAPERHAIVPCQVRKILLSMVQISRKRARDAHGRETDYSTNTCTSSTPRSIHECGSFNQGSSKGAHKQARCCFLDPS